ncbi:4-carboxy-4-hydroxy-2-oxoadipate aldolase/oxaloacetate decarboxylase [Conexibacter sp. JD483]|uniref:RraA family protein n=1 Tax=unclassified Conexibacter TaxID=2627773 RepID=UPI0027262C2C|nr:MULTISPECIES: 4-carboxy-4-hydroxy-2-oxoadipate aldolase/oxaloacetate decarboxylase [unclassified Conexibacter]MDO8187350.1 4-carboxy-4-hydroxy-2-oxoadipate aldolase/oxaloacetate decarboxylase [Conexibacter sp. CPCC 205706]MDO8200517.1 4-carboxy-4-hydroxy-2-oxoadipate aldolase/oxaloacetate decarboxylase [Conexibacter sp. CPCC 205762]MDR9370014.1 4-carboxy-4-hydroxy-2-oxoadipate aldolase/oxaloacetate decarboxylase [Conexibacter sp. JD483]
MTPELPALPPDLGAATVYEANGRRGALAPQVRPTTQGFGIVAGRALPLRCAPGDNLAVHRAVAVAEPGDVLMVDGGGILVGHLGDVLAVAALARGVVAIVVDGGVRDVAEVAELGLPVWSTGVAMRGAEKRSPGTVGEPIVCAGARVERGSWIVADDDGVVAVDPADVAAAHAGALRRWQAEEQMKTRLRAGELTLDLLNLRGAIAS